MRYRYLKERVEKHAVIELGISLFSKKKSKKRYQCETFSILLLPEFDHMVSPSSMSFLADHGFDFNTLYSKGKSFQLVRSYDPQNPLHQLWKGIVESKKKLVFHCGFLDLMFIYHSFIGKLPNDVVSFQSKIYNHFCDGISHARFYDTKYISQYFKEFKTNLTSLFNKLASDKIVVQKYVLELQKLKEKKLKPCTLLEKYGHCLKGDKCEFSHGIELNDQKDIKVKGPIQESKLHGAGFDSYATGCIFATYLTETNSELMEALGNRFYLIGKSNPLIIFGSLN